MICIKTQKGEGPKHGTGISITDENGKNLKGIKKIQVNIVPDDVVTADIEMYCSQLSIDCIKGKTFEYCPFNDALIEPEEEPKEDEQ